MVEQKREGISKEMGLDQYAFIITIPSTPNATLIDYWYSVVEKERERDTCRKEMEVVYSKGIMM